MLSLAATASFQLDDQFQKASKAYQRGDLAYAAHLLQAILAAAPNSFAVLHLLAIVRAQQGRNKEALALIDHALKINPQDVPAWMNYAFVLRQNGQSERAVDACDKALRLAPQAAQIHYQKSVALLDLGRIEQALQSSEQALSFKPDYCDALRAKAYCLTQLRRFEQALQAYNLLLAVNPNFADALNNRGSVLIELQRLKEAVHDFDGAIALNGSYLEAFTNRAVALRALERVDDALASLNAALAIDPQYVPALYQRGLILRQAGEIANALLAFENVLKLRPDHPFAHGMAAEAAMSLCDWEKVEYYATILLKSPNQGRKIPIISPLIATGLTEEPGKLLQYARRYCSSQQPDTVERLPQARLHRHKRIRVAYISSDFSSHPVGFQIVELIERHDRSRFEILAISLGRVVKGEKHAIQNRIEKAFDRFEEVHLLDDHAIAQLIRRLEVDIAIDLNGHTRGGRRRLFAYRPASVQVNFLGYPGSVGDDSLDYIIADSIVLPEGQDAYFSEKIVRLPDSFFPQDTKRSIGTVPTRTQAGLPGSAIVFCAFNHPWKITAAFFNAWMRLLSQIPNSVIWLREYSPETNDRLRREAKRQGIDSSRVVFAPYLNQIENHLARHELADLFLDTFPYNGHATASDALSSGLAVITCAGQSFAGRVSASLLYAAGLEELVTNNLHEYECLALALANDPARLHELKARLKHNKHTLALFDMGRLRLNLETAYRKMIAIAEKGDRPHAFDVEPS